MAYLTLTRISGDPERLLESCTQSAPVMDGVGLDHGLILHAAAKTEEGLLILNLWPSRDGSESAAGDSRRLGVLERLDLPPASIRREHHDVARYALFDEISGRAG
jgi:hypothetical protein